MSNLNKLTAVILAGGLGTRLRSVVANQPKVLASVEGRPFVTYLLDQLVACRVQIVVLCTGYLGRQLPAALGDTYTNDQGKLDLRYSQESQPLGTAGALRHALPWIESSQMLIMNGDSYCEVNIQVFYKLHQQHGASASLLLTYVKDTARFGAVDVADDGAVLCFREKEPVHKPGWINAGLYLVERSAVEVVPENKFYSLEKDLFPTLIGRGLHAYRLGQQFLDIGTPQSYAKAETFFAKLNTRRSFIFSK